MAEPVPKHHLPTQRGSFTRLGWLYPFCYNQRARFMPTVARDGGFQFVIHTREFSFEPPHVHVWFEGRDVRIELGKGTFLEEPPLDRRRAILEAFARHADEIRSSWERIHGRMMEGAE